MQFSGQKQLTLLLRVSQFHHNLNAHLGICFNEQLLLKKSGCECIYKIGYIIKKVRVRMDTENEENQYNFEVLYSNIGKVEEEQEAIDNEVEFSFEKKQKNMEQLQFLLSCLKNHFIFYNLSQSQLQNVARNMLFCTIPQSTFLLRQSCKSRWFFIVERGIMEIINNDKRKQELRVGDAFGQIALLYETNTNISVKAIQQCRLWAINRKDFRRVVQETLLDEYAQNKIILQNVPFLHSLSLQQKELIATAFITQTYEADQVIVEEGEPGSSFYIIKKGSVSVWKNEKELKKLHKSQTFGVKALFYNIMRQNTIKAQQQTVCLILTRQILVKLFGDQIFNITFTNMIKIALQNTDYIKFLQTSIKQKFIQKMKINIYKNGAIVINKENDKQNSLNMIIVIEGVLKTDSGQIIALQGQVLGEQFLLSSNLLLLDENLSENIVMESNGILAQISISSAKQIIGGEVDLILERSFLMLRESKGRKIKEREKKIKYIHELVIIQEMLEFTFGYQMVVGWPSKREKQKIFVLKCFCINKIQDHKFYKYLQQQSTYFQNLCHPFILQQYKTFKDQNYLYSLVQFVRGQDLYQAIRTIGLLSTDDARFYISCIVVILEYLQKENIFLRDISPECFMVDSNGYLKLVNMSTAKIIPKEKYLEKSQTLIGSPYYTAPQMIQGNGYNSSICLFSLGVLLFQFLCGYVPFGQKSEDPIEIYEQILNSPLKIPKTLKDYNGQKLITQLLNKKNPQVRMGGPNFEALKKNPWFSTINWAKLNQGKLEAPEFQRNFNIYKNEEQLQKSINCCQNCDDYLNQKLPLRSLDRRKENKYWNW